MLDMKTLESFKKETLFYTELADFAIYEREWNDFESGTKAFCVKMYGVGKNNVNTRYILQGMENTDEVLKIMQEMPSTDYYCFTDEVTRN